MINRVKKAKKETVTLHSIYLKQGMRISTKPLSKYPWILRPFFWKQKKKYGEILVPGLLWGRLPKLFMAVAMLYGVLDRKTSPISPLLRALVTVRVSQINGCHFCVDINSATLIKLSSSMEKIENLSQWKKSDIYTQKEKIVFEYLEAMTYSDQQVSDELMQRLSIFFSEDNIVEITGLIAFQNLSSKFNSALDVPSQGFCKQPSNDSHTVSKINS